MFADDIGDDPARHHLADYVDDDGGGIANLAKPRPVRDSDGRRHQNRSADSPSRSSFWKSQDPRGNAVGLEEVCQLARANSLSPPPFGPGTIIHPFERADQILCRDTVGSNFLEDLAYVAEQHYPPRYIGPRQTALLTATWRANSGQRPPAASAMARSGVKLSAARLVSKGGIRGLAVASDHGVARPKPLPVGRVYLVEPGPSAPMTQRSLTGAFV